MTDAVQRVQSAMVTALQAHPALANTLTGVYDGPPPQAVFPYISVTDGVVSDWSTKTETGREIRVAVKLWDDGEAATRVHDLIGHIEDAIDALPRDLSGWRVVSLVFLRSLIARDPQGPWAGLVEYRVRLLSTA